jgi:hypothetical protein
MKIFATALCAGTMALMSGCASIVSKSEWPVTITSDPSGALVTVKNNQGMEIHKATTPTTVVLKASAGYFAAAKYTLSFEKPGYGDSVAFLDARINPWYMGNLLFFGGDFFIGMLVIDPATGAMWKLDDMMMGSLSESRGAGAAHVGADEQHLPGNVGAALAPPADGERRASRVEAFVRRRASINNAPTGGKPEIFKSADGKKLELGVSADGNSIEYRLSDGKSGKLDKVSSGSGAKYSDDKTTIWIKGKEVVVLDTDDKIIFEGEKSGK